MSASILKIWISENFPEINVKPIFHNNPKSHGLNDVIDDLLKLKPSLLFIPDAGTNDTKECKILKEKGWSVTILDHHQKEKENPYATIVNNQFGNVNKFGSGGLVTWHYCNYIKPNSVNHLASYVMLSIISDSMSMLSDENATFVKWGKENIHSNLLPFIEKFNDNTTNNKSYSFGIISKINACIRYGTQEDKENLFYCLCGESENSEEFLKKLASVHRKQNSDKKKLLERLSENSISKDSDNYIMTITDETSPLNGLCANTMLGNENKTVFVLNYDEFKGVYSGSVRSNIDKFKDILSNSGLFNYNLGHFCSFGTSFKEENLDKIKDFLNNTLQENKPFYNVTISSEINNIPTNIFNISQKYAWIYGTNIPIPLVHIKPFILNGRDIQVMGKNKTTIKIKAGLIDLIMFYCSKDIKEKLHVGENVDFALELIGEPQLNEWNGRFSNQILINKFEVIEDEGWGLPSEYIDINTESEETDEDFDW